MIETIPPLCMQKAVDLYVGASTKPPVIVINTPPLVTMSDSSYSTGGGTFVAFLFLLIIIIIIVVVFYTSPGTHPGRHGRVRASKTRKHKSRLSKPSSTLFEPVRSQIQKTGMPPIAPLWWDDEEGAYMIQMRVGQGDVEFVLDTGSSQLSAKGHGCQWTNCGGDSCNTKACPCGVDASGKERTDCSLHYYKPAGRALKPGEGGAGMSTVLTYGSQEDTVSHYYDIVALPHVTMPCQELEMNTPRSAMKTSEYHSLGNVVVHRVSHIEGTSSSNLLGLACPSHNESTDAGSHVVLQKLFGGYDAQWSIIIRPTGGWWAMGSLPCFPNTKYMPLVNPPEFNQFVTKFYIVPIRSIAVGFNQHSLKTLSRADTPKFCLIDTGTTLTYGSPRLGAALKKKRWDERKSYFQIELGDKKNHVTITYSPAQMRDPDYPDSSVLQAEHGRTLDDFDTIFPAGTCLLFGIFMMRNCYWEFDLAQERVGIQELPPLK